MNDSTGDFVGRTGLPAWAAAATRDRHIELQPMATLKRKGILETTLRHELAHAFIDAVSHDHAPRWLAEGFALYLAGEGQMISRYEQKEKLTKVIAALSAEGQLKAQLVADEREAREGWMRVGE